ncbi:MAG: hypothetical protein GY699_03360 [Desulfobacteraceae bacterium]|nr:hypothetical protein [Desulfobacteraceae bacterium]
MFFEKILLLVSLLLLLFSPSNAMAYIGPGMGLSAIGTVVAFTGAILLAIVGFVWYPLKRLLAKRKTKNK